MPGRHVVVDGSNIATEGRNLPSLAQLDQAVREYLLENPDDNVTVVVDASFAHRIDPSELKIFEEAEAANELVSPPAGAIGRGDAFLLRIADKTGATVLSNDSFQEFHGEYDWLFSNGRLIGGKPVPGVGWIFTPRTPVRGPKSREAVKEAKRRKSTGEPMDGTGLDLAAQRRRQSSPRAERKVEAAIATATDEATGAKGRRRRGRTAATPAEPVNEPLGFISFVSAHPLGSTVTGTVDSFSSHGAFIDAGGVRCYVPLSAMGDPPPRKGRDVMAKGEEREFVVQAYDPPRRGVELALPGFVHLSATPTDETVEAEITPVAPAKRARRGRAAPAAEVEAPAGEVAPPAKRIRKKAAAAVEEAPAVEARAAEAPAPAPAKRTRKKAAAVEEAPAAEVRAAEAPAPAPAKRARKKAAAPVVEAPEVVPEPSAEAPAPAPAKRARKKVAAAVVEAPEVVAESPAEAPAPAPAPAPAKRARKKAAAGVAGAPVAAKATATRARTQTPPQTERPAVAAPSRPRKARAAAAPAVEAPAEPAPAKRPRERTEPPGVATPAPKARKAAKAAAPHAPPTDPTPEATVTPEPAIAGRRSPRRAAAATKGQRGSTGRA